MVVIVVIIVPHSSIPHKPPIGPRVVPFLGLPYRILNMNPQKELLWGLWAKVSLSSI